MTRRVWHEAAPSVEAVATLLEEEARDGDIEPPPGQAPRLDLNVLHQAALVVARRRLQTAHQERDRVLAQEVRAIEDLQRSANLLVERLREWYALHAPEATRRVEDAEALTALVARHGDRGALMAALDDAAAAATSLGSDLAPEDVAAVQGFAAALQALHVSWRTLETRVEQLMAEVAPNVASVVGPVLGGRMIAQAGGLPRLAMWPTGTVQLLGAETALFRHIKEGTRPPKHGILFQHPTVFQAPPWQRGAVARAMAAATSTAARADAFTRRDIQAQLKEALEKDLGRIRSEKAKPPKRRPRDARKAPRDGARGPKRGQAKQSARSSGPGAPGGQRTPRGPRDGPRDGRSKPSRSKPPRGGPSRGGPPSDGPARGGSKPRQDGRGPPRRGPGRKVPGAFRDDNGPAKPPGR